MVPVKEHPKFNFVGKLLGPKGNSMKRLQDDTMTKMAVLGKGSMRNKQQVMFIRKSQMSIVRILTVDCCVFAGRGVAKVAGAQIPTLE